MVAKVVAGLLQFAGPCLLGSAWYQVAHSGKMIHSQSLQSGSGPLRGFDLDLDPSMNPLRVTFKARVDAMSRGPGAQHLHVNAHFRMNGRTVHSASASFSLEREKDRGGTVTVTLGDSFQSTTASDFAIAQAGRYRVEPATSNPGTRSPLRELSIEIRGKVRGWDVKRIGWGIGLLVGGVLFGFLFGSASKRDASPGN